MPIQNTQLRKLSRKNTNFYKKLFYSPPFVDSSACCAGGDCPPATTVVDQPVQADAAVTSTNADIVNGCCDCCCQCCISDALCQCCFAACDSCWFIIFLFFLNLKKKALFVLLIPQIAGHFIKLIKKLLFNTFNLSKKALLDY